MDRVNNFDVFEVLVEVFERMFFDEVKKFEQFEKKIIKVIEEIFGIFVKVWFVELKIIERSEGKAKRVIDKRKI